MRSGPATHAFVPVLSDTEPLAQACRGLWVGTGGDVKGVLRDDTDPQTFPNVQSGTLLPYVFKQIYASGTDASDLVAVY